MLFVIAERYVLLGVFSYTAPLPFPTWEKIRPAAMSRPMPPIPVLVRPRLTPREDIYESSLKVILQKPTRHRDGDPGKRLFRICVRIGGSNIRTRDREPEYPDPEAGDAVFCGMELFENAVCHRRALCASSA